jgi:hypothetical protein
MLIFAGRYFVKFLYGRCKIRLQLQAVSPNGV